MFWKRESPISWMDYLKTGAGKPCAKHVNVDEEPLWRFKATRENSPVNRGALLLVGSITSVKLDLNSHIGNG